MLKLSASQYEKFRKNKWKNFVYPTRAPLPKKPFHPDGDQLFRNQGLRRSLNSDAVIEHVANSGRLNIRTGSTVPGADGKVSGYVINVASPNDPVFEITDKPSFITRSSRKILMKVDINKDLIGLKIPIGKNFVGQGFPMRNYSDAKMHIVDPVRRLIIEIQYLEDVSWSLMSPFGTGYTCHALSVYSMDVDSTDRTKVRGRSAAKFPLLESTLTYDGIIRDGISQISTCGVPAAAKKPNFVAPAVDSDGPSEDVNAVRMGEILTLSAEAYNDMRSKCGPQGRAVIECWHRYGILVTDTGDNISFGLEPDNRWDQEDLAPLKTLTMQDFNVNYLP